MIILAVFYLAKGAYFLGVVQIVVYTGAIMMLFLFVRDAGRRHRGGLAEGDQQGPALAGPAVRARLRHPAVRGHRPTPRYEFNGLGAGQRDGGNVRGSGRPIFTKYVLAFEITGALLITAAVGAMVLTHRERTERALTQRELAEERVREGKQLAAAARARRLRPAQRGGHRRPAARRHVSELSVSETLRSAARSATCPPRRCNARSRRWSSAQEERPSGPRAGRPPSTPRRRRSEPGRTTCTCPRCCSRSARPGC